MEEQEYTEQPLEETLDDSQVEEQPEVAEAQPKKSNADNIRVLRERAERAAKLEAERDELRRQMEAMKAASSPAPVEEDDDWGIDPDSLVEGKHLSKIAKKYKQLEQKLKSYEQQSTTSIAETRLRSQYADFDKVVSKENIERLREEYPDIAANLAHSPDLYSKGSAAYTLIKRLGIAQDDVFVEDKNRATYNATKPRPLSSISPQQGDSPLSRANAFANGLTDDLKKQLHAEMIAAMKAR